MRKIYLIILFVALIFMTLWYAFGMITPKDRTKYKSKHIIKESSVMVFKDSLNVKNYRAYINNGKKTVDDKTFKGKRLDNGQRVYLIDSLYDGDIYQIAVYKGRP